jgi:hypothetical protein
MATSETTIHIFPPFFTEQEETLVEHGRLSAAVFCFASGVRALRLKNESGQLVTCRFRDNRSGRRNSAGAI